MTEGSYNRIELAIKAVGPLLVLAGLVFGVVQFKVTTDLNRKDQREQYKETLTEARLALAEAQREAKKPFYERQLALYLEATDVTSRISDPSSEEDKRAATARFWQMYWGQLALVESQEVESAMVAFQSVLVDTALTDQERAESLRRKSLDLAHKCRDSLKESWDVELAELAPDR